MPRYSFPAASGGPAVDITKCKPFLKEAINKRTADSIYTYETLLSITGKGFLDKLYFMSHNSDANVRMKVIIDGVLTWAGYAASGSTTFTGIMNEEALVDGKARGAAKAAQYTNTLRDIYHDYPSTVDTETGFWYISVPLYFKESLLIQVASGDSTKDIDYVYSGGSY